MRRRAVTVIMMARVTTHDVTLTRNDLDTVPVTVMLDSGPGSRRARVAVGLRGRPVRGRRGNVTITAR